MACCKVEVVPPKVHDLIDSYEISVSKLTTMLFEGQLNSQHNCPFFLLKLWYHRMRNFTTFSMINRMDDTCKAWYANTSLALGFWFGKCWQCLFSLKCFVNCSLSFCLFRILPCIVSFVYSVRNWKQIRSIIEYYFFFYVFHFNLVGRDGNDNT